MREAVHGPQDTVDTKEHDSGRVARLIDLLPKVFIGGRRLSAACQK